MTLDGALRDMVRTLTAAGVPSPQVDAEELMGHVLGVGRGEVARRRVLAHELSGHDAQRLTELAARRAQRIPLQHLTGVAHFRRLTLAVGPGVFVPRPETEVAVGLAVAALGASTGGAGTLHHPLRLVDLCAGSGVIALSVVTETATAGLAVTAVAVEVSADAAAWTRRNADRLGDGRVEVRQEAVEDCCPDLDGLVDVVTANPPYIPDDALPRDAEVRDHDPSLALFGGPDGLDVVRQVAVAAARLCRPGGAVVVEHGEHQGPAVTAVLSAAGFGDPATHDDLTGRPRATVARLRP